MCLTIPGKILEIKEGKATVKSSRETTQIDLGLVFGAKKGDWILYATNRAVKVISEQDAKEIIELLEDNYHPVNIDNLPKKFVDVMEKIRNLNIEIRDLKGKQRGNKGGTKGDERESGGILKGDIEYLLSLTDKDCLETLYAEANVLRKSRIDDFVCIHGIIEFSNYCKNNCLYCGIRKDQNIQRYRMFKDEIVETAVNAVDDEGYKLLVLQSGEDEFYTDEDLIEIIKTIKNKARVFVFLSVGERSAEFYKKAFKAGASGSLMRFETSNKKLYEKMRPDKTLDLRIKSLEEQKKSGYYMASGSLIGLPGQTLEDIADDILMIRKLGVPMISSGPFLPAKGTPLYEKGIHKGFKGGTQGLIELFLKYIAICRFVMPDVKIPVTTALETLDPESGRHRALLAGANALMFNLTPDRYCEKYQIYDNKYREREKVWQKYGLFKGEESYQMLEQRMNSLF